MSSLYSGSTAATLRSASALVFVPDLETLELDAGDAHHLLDVLRLGPSETVAAADGRGAWRCCALRAALPPGGGGAGGPERGGRRGRARSTAHDPARGARLEATGPVVVVPEPARTLTVGFAMTKGDRPEWTVQKLTELGVDRIWPLLTGRTVVRLTPAGAARRGERLRRVAREAAAQSRRPRLPEVADPLGFETAVESLAHDEGAVLLAEPGGGHLGEHTAAVLVGPEGGWDADELACGVDHLDLGASVLRAETAAVVAGTLLAAVRAGAVRAP